LNLLLRLGSYYDFEEVLVDKSLGFFLFHRDSWFNAFIRPLRQVFAYVTFLLDQKSNQKNQEPTMLQRAKAGARSQLARAIAP